MREGGDEKEGRNEREGENYLVFSFPLSSSSCFFFSFSSFLLDLLFNLPTLFSSSPLPLPSSHFPFLLFVLLLLSSPLLCFFPSLLSPPCHHDGKLGEEREGERGGKKRKQAKKEKEGREVKRERCHLPTRDANNETKLYG